MKFYIIIAFIVFAFAYINSVCFRLVVKHPFKTVFYGISDGIDYVLRKRWNECPTGRLIAYTALFGGGKTLSVVHYIVGMYKKYNNKTVYDRNRKKFVTQKIHVISNVDLAIPFERFVSLEQIVRVAEQFREIDMQNDTLTCTLVLGDEFSVQMNSREFKKNIDPLFLNTLLTCRHHHISLIYNGIEKSMDGIHRRTNVYFCHPFCSGERGSNENNNKLIRRFIPKGANIGDWTETQIKEIESFMNNYPRKLFCGMSVNEFKERLIIP